MWRRRDTGAPPSGVRAMRRRGPPCPLVWNAKIIIPARGSRRMTARSSSPLCTIPKPGLPYPSPPCPDERAGARPKAASGPIYPLPSRQRVHYAALFPITNRRLRSCRRHSPMTEGFHRPRNYIMECAAKTVGFRQHFKSHGKYSYLKHNHVFMIFMQILAV